MWFYKYVFFSLPEKPFQKPDYRTVTASIFHLDGVCIFIWSFPDDVTFTHIDYQQLQSQDSISYIIEPFLEFCVVHLTYKRVALWAQ